MPEEPWDKDDEQVAVRHADASVGYIIENQHEEKSKRGSEATSEEQTDEWRKTKRFGQEAPDASACETQSRPGSVLVQKSGHVDDDVQISALDASWTKESLHWRSVGAVSRRRCRRSQKK